MTTETRVYATDQAARHRFGRYRLVVSPFSALIRRRMLAVLRATVARAAPPDADAGRLGDGAVDTVPNGVLHPPAQAPQRRDGPTHDYTGKIPGSLASPTCAR